MGYWHVSRTNVILTPSVDKLRENVQASVKALLKKGSYKKKPDDARLQEQEQVYRALRARFLSGTTLP